MLALELIGGAVVLLGVAYVLARGMPVFDDEPDDSIDRGLPDGRPLASDDIPRLRFRIGLRGYRMSDVDAALDAVRTTLADFEQQVPAPVAESPEGPLARGRGRRPAPAPVTEPMRPLPTEGPLSRGHKRPHFPSAPAEAVDGSVAEESPAEATPEPAEQPPSAGDRPLSEMELEGAQDERDGVP